MTSEAEVSSSRLQPRKTNNIYHNVKKPKLEEYRAKSEEDMRAHYVGSRTPEEFLDVLLPFHPRTNKRPLCQSNPFESMKEADTWAESKVVEEFVSLSRIHF